MIRIEDFIQVKAFARQDGAFLALLWTLSFAAMMFMPESTIGNLLALATPFFVGWRLCSFRNYALDGAISLRRGYCFSVYTFVYASIIFAVVQFLYFKFLDHGTFFTMLQASVTALENAYSQAGVSTDDLKTTLKLMQELSPINWAFIFMMQNMLTGVIVGLPIAVMCRRTKRQ